MKHLRSVVALLLLLSVAAFLINCDQKSSTGPGIVTPSYIGEISLVADNGNLYTIPGTPVTTKITATVTDTSGTAVPGILVKFTAPAIGSISTTQDTTDLDGKVEVTFNSQNEFGAATIKASVSSGGTTLEKQTTIYVYPLTGLANEVKISLFPQTVYQATYDDQEIDVSVYVMDSLNVGIPGIHPSLSTSLGSIELVDVTNSAGKVTSLVHTQGDTGVGIVKATVTTTLGGAGLSSLPPGVSAKKLSGEELDAMGMGGLRGLDDDVYEITASDTFYVKLIDEQITRITVAATPATFQVAPNETGSTTIRATVIDDNNVGIPGVDVSFSTNQGTLASGTGTTDSTGTTQVTWLSTPNEYGTAWVWASIGAFEDSTSLLVEPTSSSSGQIALYTDTYVIWADYGITTAEITAVLKDADNQVIAGVPVVFTSDYGAVNSPVTTDTSGTARALFRDFGTPSYPDSTTIKAKYNPLGISTSIKVMIEPALGVENVDLDAGTNSIQANGADSTELNATVRLENGTLAPNGTTVHFIVAGDNLGDIVPAYAEVGESGNAISFYHAGSTTGTDTLYAMVEGVYSDPIVIDLHAGPPSSVDITSDTSAVYVNGGQTITVTATVRDTTGNLVQDGEGVIFETTRGSLSPTSSQTFSGVATTTLSPSSSAGDAWVKAKVGMAVDSMLVQFLPSEPSFISLSTQYPAITVSIGGDTTQTQIYANVKDASGNNIGNGTWVHFEIVNGFPGGGVNINNSGLEDSTQTIGGKATVVLNAGTLSGPVQIRAWTFDSIGNEISAQKSLVTIGAGPPSTINIDAMSLPEDGGGDTWKVEVSAIVRDANGNEVPDSIGVSFYTIPQTTGQIGSGAVTGNEGTQGANPGVAYTWLTYHSNEVFDILDIVAYCMVEGDSVVGTKEYTLPIDANGTLSMTVSPISWNYTQFGDPAIMTMSATLKDGHGNHIDGGRILFESPKGLAYWYINPAREQFWEKLTGPDAIPNPFGLPEPYDSTGKAVSYLVTTFDQAFLDPAAATVTAQVLCYLVGYEDLISSAPRTVEFQQNVGDVPPEDPAAIKE